MEIKPNSCRCVILNLAIAILSFGVSPVLAFYPTIQITPSNPQINDTVIVSIGTGAGNLCWHFDSSNVSAGTNTRNYKTFISHQGKCSSGCFSMPQYFTVIDTIGTLSAGEYHYRVDDFSYRLCGDTTFESDAIVSFVVENPACNPCTTGDANGDGSANIADVTFLIARIFAGGPAPLCDAEADVTGDGKVNIGDVTAYIAHIFTGGALSGCL